MPVLHRQTESRQCTAVAFTAELREAGNTGSIGSVGDVLDNALMESVIEPFKPELIDRHHATWRDRLQVEIDTASWVAWYNHDRLHSSIGYVRPVEFETNYQARLKTPDLEPKAV